MSDPPALDAAQVDRHPGPETPGQGSGGSTDGGQIAATQIVAPDVDGRDAADAPARAAADPYATTRPDPAVVDAAAGSRFRILKFHAGGGIGDVFVAQDQELGRDVALKQLKREFSADAGSCEQFVQEAQITGLLEHPGIVPVYGLGTHPDGRPYYAMQFIRGDTMLSAIRQAHSEGATGQESQLRLRRLLGCFVTVCNTIAFAHSRRIIHRDLKPGNIMLGKFGETLVVDWGLAKQLDTPVNVAESSLGPLRLPAGASAAAEPGDGVCGTLAYMGPEQARGRSTEVGMAADVYLLGATLFHILTGRAPRESNNSAELLRQAAAGEYAIQALRKSGIPKPLAAVCMQAMSVAPADRYSDAAQIAGELERWLSDQPVQAYPEPLVDRLSRLARRNRGAVRTAVAAMAAIAVVATLAMIVVNGHRRRAEAQARENSILAQDLQRELTRTQLQHGLSEFAAGRTDTGIASLRAAYRDCLSIDPSKPAIRRILADRVTFGGRCRVPPMMHDGAITAVRFSRDGQSLLTAGGSTVRVWDVSTGSLRFAPLVHPAEVVSATFSADGTRLVTACRSDPVRIWDARTGGLIETLPQVADVVLSPSGDRMVTIDDDQQMRLREVSAAPAVDVPLPHAGEISGIQFSTDGRRLATSAGQSVRIWNATDGGPIGAELLHDGHVQRVEFSPDGKLLLTACDRNAVRLWDVGNGQLRLGPLPQDGPATSLCFSPDGIRFGTSTRAQVRLWDVKTGGPAAPAIHLPDDVSCLAFSPDGTELLSACMNGALRQWDVMSGRPAGPQFHVGEEIIHAVYSPDGESFATCTANAIVRVWRASSTNMPDAFVRHDVGTVSAAAISRDGSLVLLAGSSGQVQAWDPQRRRTFPPHQLHAGRIGAVIVSEDRSLAITAGDDRSVLVWGVETGTPVCGPLLHAEPVVSLAISADGSRIATGSGDGKVHVFAIPSGEETGPARAHDEFVWALGFSPDGGHLAAGSNAGNVRVWEVSAGTEPVHTLELAGQVRSLAWFPNGKQLLAAAKSGSGGVVGIWELDTDLKPHRVFRHEHPVDAAIADPEAATIVTAGRDVGMVTRWDINSGAVLGESIIQNGATQWIALSSDARRAVVCSDAGTAVCWQLKELEPPADDAFDEWIEFLSGATEQTVRREAGEQLQSYLRLMHAESAATDRGWHELRAEQSAAQGNSFAEEFHRRRLGDAPSARAPGSNGAGPRTSPR